jgi:hypothetical protein
VILTDGRRQRRDLGPGSGLGQMGDMVLANVVPDSEIGLPAVPIRECAMCHEPAQAGKLTCGPVCARRYQGRWSLL